MTEHEADDGLAAGRGIPPRLQWSFCTESPLVVLDYAAESGEVLAGDDAGGLYLLDRNGRVRSLTRGYYPLRGVAWSDTGQGGVVLVGETRLCRLTPRLETAWSLDMPNVLLAAAVDPFGQYVAAALDNGGNFIFDIHKQRVAAFETIRPLSFLRFLTSEPVLLGAAEYGHLCLHALDGGQLWSEKLWTNVGDLAATGDGSTIVIAGFNHGLQVYDGEGGSRGSYMIDGTPHRVAITFEPDRLAAATIERGLYWLDADGELLWAATLPEDVCRVHCDPLGNWLLCGLSSGRIMRLSWEA